MTLARDLFILGLVVGSLALVWWPGIPFGVLGEWTWDRIPLDARPQSGHLIGAGALAFFSLAYLGFVRVSARRLESQSRFRVAVKLAALVLAGFAWLSGILWSLPDGFGSSRIAWVLYYTGSSGYFVEARNAEDLNTFLGGYEELMAEGDVLHVGTHPPGLFIGYMGLIRVCEANPGLTHLAATIPAPLQEAFHFLRTEVRNGPAPFEETDAIVLWLAALVTQLAAVLTVVPLYLLIRRWHPRHDAWLLAAAWPLTPALAVFLPKSDVLYPVIATSGVWLWVTAVDRRSLILAAVAGAVGWFAMILSLAFLPTFLVAAIWGAGVQWKRGGSRLSSLSLWVAAGGTFALLVLATWLAWDLNLLNTWVWNFRNHGRFYSEFPRTYWKWLVVNPTELVVGCGAPVIGWALIGFFRRNWESAESRAAVCSMVGVWIVLWLSGKNMGEAARLWILLMPGCLVLAAFALRSQASASLRSRSLWRLLALQTIVSLLTVTRWTGFDYSQWL